MSIGGQIPATLELDKGSAVKSGTPNVPIPSTDETDETWVPQLKIQHLKWTGLFSY